ncbi:MAG: iron transporter [Gammaproteobacteria bacterium]|nr:iron transporter [Gammaproteobacteria bacterium]
MKLKLVAALAVALLLPVATAQAKEHAVSHKPIVQNGMIISAAYLQPVHMAPMLPSMEGTADVHLEADIHANKDNPQGFQPGAWIPYLTITYHLTKEDSDWKSFGPFMPMIANDGPHYGRNIQLDGPGKYTLTLFIEPPPAAGFYRHTDKETGVAPWWQPFTVSWTFVWAGNGKLGGY